MTLKHYGWECSPYSSKTRTYLRFKGTPHEDIQPTFLKMRQLTSRVGFMVMPVVEQPDGSVLQDTSDIIDALEAQQPEPSIIPPGPRQRLVSLLLELNADEWMPLIAMHYRWNSEENRKFILGDFGKNAAPWLPGFLQRKVAGKIAGKMASYLPVLGITEQTQQAIEAWTEELLGLLDAHFSEHDFLLGGRPCLGDFSLYGPLYAHVRRDPASAPLVEAHEHVIAWMERLQNPAATPGDFLEGDEVPVQLWPILRRMFREQFPVLREAVSRTQAWLEEHPEAQKLPRSLGDVEFVIGSATETRRLLTFQHWMFQRSLFFYQSLSSDHRESVDALLRELGGLDAMQVEIKRPLMRRNFRVVPG
jgi:glutathione S-transferase